IIAPPNKHCAIFVGAELVSARVAGRHKVCPYNNAMFIRWRDKKGYAKSASHFWHSLFFAIFLPWQNPAAFLFLETWVYPYHSRLPFSAPFAQIQVYVHDKFFYFSRFVAIFLVTFKAKLGHNSPHTICVSSMLAYPHWVQVASYYPHLSYFIRY
ncbi:MAG: hypothetical protein FWF44_06520, partial [Defluviitaleaceae bacterium]|nr:hypothetical protein [Defluviitaleaceae bacterium]